MANLSEHFMVNLGPYASIQNLQLAFRYEKDSRSVYRRGGFVNR
jgi:hypothetical protein